MNLTPLKPSSIRHSVTNPPQLRELERHLQNRDVCVIRGGGVLANALCATLAPAMPRVQFVWAPGKRPQPPRLDAGLTLRRNTLEALAIVLKTDLDSLIGLLGGSEACFHVLKMGMMSAAGLENPLTLSVDGAPFGLSTPPYHISEVMINLMGNLDLSNVHLISGALMSPWDLSSGIPVTFADGTEDRWNAPVGRTAVLNASPAPFHQTHRVPAARPIDKYVVAAQVPVTSRATSRIPLADTFSLGQYGEAAVFLTPCADKIPGRTVTDYAVLAELIDPETMRTAADPIQARKNAGDVLLSHLSDWGLVPVDPENTMGTVAIPGSQERTALSEGPVYQAGNDFGSPYAVVGGDGMFYALGGALRLAKIWGKTNGTSRNFTDGLRFAYRIAANDIQGWLDDGHHASLAILYNPALGDMLDYLRHEDVLRSMTDTYLGMDLLRKIRG